ncbi:CpaD family pilus assembly protein [Sphingomonas sp. NY01]|uniref:CpaD family pilus assembly protein n=1 Tax=Sphingomonas sp. NY01 TaxID=2968057 RepID=UPI00315D6804
MTHTLTLTSSLAAALLLAGCTGTQNRGVESVHQPVVDRSDYALDLGVIGGRLAAGEEERLDGWARTLRLGYGDHVAIDDPATEAPGARAEVAELVARYGLLLDEAAASSQAPVTPATIRVVVSRTRAAVPGCPDWSRDSSLDWNQNTSSNYGCATNATLAAMVANPADLVRGHAGRETADPAQVFKSIDLYRKAVPTGGGGTTVGSAGGAGGGGGGASAGGSR